MDYDEMMRDVRRTFGAIEEGLDLGLHECYQRLGRLDLLTRPEVPPAPEAGEETIALALPRPAPVELPAWARQPAPVAVEPYSVERHTDLPWWRRMLRRADRWFARQSEEAAA